MFLDVADMMGPDALEREGYLFIHLFALTEVYTDLEQVCDKYPPLKLSDDELDRVKLRVEPEFRDRFKPDKSFSDDGSVYNTLAFAEEGLIINPTGKREELKDFEIETTIRGHKHVVKGATDYHCDTIADLVEAVKAMAEL